MFFDFTSLPAPARYKLLSGCILPRPIALVSTVDAQGVRNAAPYSFFNVMSHDPPLIVLGIDQRRPETPKDTAANIRAIGDFVVNLVDMRIAEAMSVCAIDFPPGIDEFDEAGLTPVASAKVAPPRIAEAPVSLECRLRDELRYPGGRSIVVGEVVAFHVRDGVVDSRFHVDALALDLVGRMAGAGGYCRLSDPFSIARLTPEEWNAAKRSAIGPYRE
jgi:flavin reductase (DIM6/NTAB) family NADH-FMN oxidoreductase RutF